MLRRALYCITLKKNDQIYCPPNYGDTINDDGEILEGVWRQIENNNFPGRISFFNAGKPMDQYKAMRNFLKDYLNSPAGSVPWQEKSSYTN